MPTKSKFINRKTASTYTVVHNDEKSTTLKRVQFSNVNGRNDLVHSSVHSSNGVSPDSLDYDHVLEDGLEEGEEDGMEEGEEEDLEEDRNNHDPYAYFRRPMNEDELRMEHDYDYSKHLRPLGKGFFQQATVPLAVHELYNQLPIEVEEKDLDEKFVC